MFTGKMIAFIGPGVMAEAMVAGLIRQQVAPPGGMIVSGPRQEQVDHLAVLYGVHPETDNAAAVRQADVVVLSVKPQRLTRVLAGLSGQLKPSALVLSIVAGASIQKISSALHHNLVVRSMPNTPAQIGEGITVWTAAPDVSEEQRSMASQILSALGEEIFVEDESYLDMATALSGTGPAYVFLFMEAMVDAGVHLGFPRRLAERLVAQTVRGSVDYYNNSKTKGLSIWQVYATWLHPQVVHLPLHCITSKRQASGQRSRGPYGLHMNALKSLAKVGRAHVPEVRTRMSPKL